MTIEDRTERFSAHYPQEVNPEAGWHSRTAEAVCFSSLTTIAHGVEGVVPCGAGCGGPPRVSKIKEEGRLSLAIHTVEGMAPK